MPNEGGAPGPGAQGQEKAADPPVNAEPGAEQASTRETPQEGSPGVDQSPQDGPVAAPDEPAKAGEEAAGRVQQEGSEAEPVEVPIGESAETDDQADKPGEVEDRNTSRQAP